MVAVALGSGRQSTHTAVPGTGGVQGRRGRCQGWQDARTGQLARGQAGALPRGHGEGGLRSAADAAELRCRATDPRCTRRVREGHGSELRSQRPLKQLGLQQYGPRATVASGTLAKSGDSEICFRRTTGTR